MSVTISANVLVRNEIKHVDAFVRNMIDACIDEVIFLDGGSSDGTYERLLEYKVKYPYLRVLHWEQPEGSEYKQGFNEVARRNLMIEASSMDWCLYIDIDERVPIDFKSRLEEKTMSSVLLVAFPRYHFWQNGIRVNMSDDKVWYPDLNYRLFRRDQRLRFGSHDANGLHNYLLYKGKRVMGGFNKAKVIYTAIQLRNRCLLSLLGVKILNNNNVCVFHLHYYDLSTPKINDLRRREFDNEIKIVSSENGGLSYQLQDKIVPCIPVSNVYGAQIIIERYIK